MTPPSALLMVGFMALAGFLASPATAATYPVDDSASLPGQSDLALSPERPAPGQRSGSLVEGAATVTVALDTARWLHRTGRIYMRLPDQPIGPVSVSWTTQGRFLPGALVSGQRALIYAGPITGARISDTLALTVEADGRRLAEPQRLDFKFEIDVN